MVSTFTPNLRLTKQGTNDNPNTWGTIVNQQVITLLEEAISGVADINCTGSSNIDLSATTENGVTDDARHAVLELTGTIGADIQLILPAVEKVYFIRSNFTGAYTITVIPTGGSAGIEFTNTETGLIYTNGTNIYNLTATGYLLASNNLSDLVSASTARTNLGLGTAAVLDVGTTANKVIQLDGSAKLPAVDGSQLTGISLGGTMSAQNANNVAITGGTITGITDLAIADGGTGASTAAAARTNLGIVDSAVTSSASGKIVLGAVTIQWGASTGIGDVTFPTAFSAAPYSVQITVNANVNNTISVYSITSTQFSKTNDKAFTWLAIGPT